MTGVAFNGVVVNELARGVAIGGTVIKGLSIKGQPVWDSSDHLTHMFFDSVNGLDTNNGLTLSTAKQSLYNIPASGLCLNLVRGSKWRGGLSSTNATLDGLTIQAVGQGEDPILDGSVIVNSWIDNGNGTWSVSKQLPNAIALSGVVQGRVAVYRNGLILLNQPTLADCQSTASSFFIPNEGDADNTTQTITINIGADAANDDNTEVCDLVYGVYISPAANNVTVKGLQLQKFAHNNGPLSVGFNAIIRDCVVDSGGKHHTYNRSGEYTRNTLINTDKPTPSNTSNSVLVPFTDTGADKTYYKDVNIWTKNLEDSGIAPTNISALYTHSAGVARSELTHLERGVYRWLDHIIGGDSRKFVLKDLQLIEVGALLAGVTTVELVIDSVVFKCMNPSVFSRQTIIGDSGSIDNSYFYLPSNLTNFLSLTGGTTTMSGNTFYSESTSTLLKLRTTTTCSSSVIGCVSERHTNTITSNCVFINNSSSADFNAYIGATQYTDFASYVAATDDTGSVYVKNSNKAAFWLNDPSTGDYRVSETAVVTDSSGIDYVGTMPDGSPLSGIGCEGLTTAWGTIAPVPVEVLPEVNTGSGVTYTQHSQYPLDPSSLADGVTMEDQVGWGSLYASRTTSAVSSGVWQGVVDQNGAYHSSDVRTKTTLTLNNITVPANNDIRCLLKSDGAGIDGYDLRVNANLTKIRLYKNSDQVTEANVGSGSNLEYSIEQFGSGYRLTVKVDGVEYINHYDPVSSITGTKAAVMVMGSGIIGNVTLTHYD